MNSRQEKLVEDLKTSFEKMNESAITKGNLIDINAILGKVKDEEKALEEVDAYNETVFTENNSIMRDIFNKLQPDLEQLGLSCELDLNPSVPVYNIKIKQGIHKFFTIVLERQYTHVTNNRGSRTKYTLTGRVKGESNGQNRSYDSLNSLLTSTQFQNALKQRIKL